MKAEIQQLVALQNLDTTIRRLQDDLEAIPQRRAEIEKEFDQRAFEIRALENARDEARHTRTRLETEVSEQRVRVERAERNLMSSKKQDEYTAAIREADARGEPLATSATFCLPQGMPSMMGGGGPFPMEILVSEGQVTIIQEAYNQVRRIYLDRPQLPLDEIEPGFYGRSVGHWEGDTLVVDTIGVKESVEFRNVPHTLDMRITERIRLAEPDVLIDEITIEDPAVLTEPWHMTFTFSRLDDYEMMEYVCEDNREYADESGVTRLRLR